MKSDISRFGEKLILRDTELRQVTAKANQVSEPFVPASNPQVGYKLPFSIGSRPFVTKQGPGNDDILGKATHHGEGTGRLFIGEAHPNQLRTQETAPSSTYEGAGKAESRSNLSSDENLGGSLRNGPLTSGASTSGGVSHAPDSQLFCRACPQYGHALIFPRKCYYEAQCPLPLLFCANQHGEKAVKITLVHRHGRAHPTQNFLHRLSSTLSKKIAYKNPELQRTNFGWRKKQ